MSYPAAPPQAPQGVAAPTKPGFVTISMIITVLTALAAIIGGVLLISGGIDLYRSAFANSAVSWGLASAEDARAMADSMTEQDFVDFGVPGILQGRGYMMLVPGVLLLLFGLFTTKAATWARVLVTVFAPFTLLFCGLFGFEGSSTTQALSLVAVILSVVTLVVTWLPPNNRYAKGLKAVRAA